MDDPAVSLAALLIRLTLGVTMLAHGWNHVWGGGRIAGTTRWFDSIGMRAPRLQAIVASTVELGAGVLLLLGLLTPLAAAGVVGTMFVALVSNHIRNGFFIFRPGEGYEYVLMIIVVAIALGALGGGELSIDDALELDIDGWTGAAIAAGVGITSGGLTLTMFWRRPQPS